MAQSRLLGLRIHIAGSISNDLAIASTEEVKRTRQLVAQLVGELALRGATFVIPVDAEKRRSCDDMPICFDWLVWETLHLNLEQRPLAAPNPLAIAVQHHKTEEQIPPAFEGIWDELRISNHVQIENVSHWNMNSKRMEAQAKWGDVLIAIGGTDGVLYLANLYHDAGKPVVPIKSAVSHSDSGGRRLFSEVGLSNLYAPRLFKTKTHDAHTWINRINFPTRTSINDRVSTIIELLEELESPSAFAVRLLDKKHGDYSDVQYFFDNVVRVVIEDELGYKLTVVDGLQPFEEPTVDQEIFSKLYRSQLVLADITGMRPNCLLELGYALGRELPTMLMARQGTKLPFDIQTLAGLLWKTDAELEDRRREFRDHWKAVKNRPPLVPMKSLIS